MPARRPRLRPARLVAIFMALLSLAVAILWVDSYREREIGPITLSDLYYATQFADGLRINTKRIFEVNGIIVLGKNPLNVSWMRTFNGSLIIAQQKKRKQAVFSPPNLKQWHHFGYSHVDYIAFYESAIGSGDATPVPLRMRQVSSSCGALFAVFAAYPTIYFIRGPLRRRKRRRRGQCLDCGYDLRGSAGNCPECGAAALIRLT